ncbi:ubiquitin fusion degradation protein 1 homolog [Juglans microcarpa x Juglans regia]|uniref:ubiquitin fusion degradation protein 1 homolog n=1 Tax=Juglans microcarpa x Juglans regia TaxID=2249226 RepID=UPI001B7DB474|nr:ubiquitin fusion degradation protein 1 homolog [Juglans microcarpa x Juglans regia]
MDQSAELGDDQYDHFEQAYRCFPLSFCEKSHLECGDKIIMPASALDHLAYSVFDFPMLFELLNPDTGRATHCGVQEFVADEGLAFLPNWMMEHMQLREGDLLIIKSVSLQKATYVKLQPHSKDFLDLSNPRAVLERTLRNFFCLTKDDTIMIMYNDKKFYIDVLETRPSEAVSIFDTDCEVDFAPPLDYQEPERLVNGMATEELQEKDQAVVEDNDVVKTCEAFSGVGRRLDGKASMESGSQSDYSSKLKQLSLGAADQGKSKAIRSNSVRKPGKLILGSDAAPMESKQQSSENVALKKEEEKFQPFTGKSYRLRD